MTSLPSDPPPEKDSEMIRELTTGDLKRALKSVADDMPVHIWCDGAFASVRAAFVEHGTESCPTVFVLSEDEDDAP
jgi:hypothetical protein